MWYFLLYFVCALVMAFAIRVSFMQKVPTCLPALPKSDNEGGQRLPSLREGRAVSGVAVAAVALVQYVGRISRIRRKAFTEHSAGVNRNLMRTLLLQSGIGKFKVSAAHW